MALTKKQMLIAACGMNCGLCLAYQREKNHCPGCRNNLHPKSISIAKCIIKNCKNLSLSKSGFCYDCQTFPCLRLKQLDKRYRTKYAMSMLENLEKIRVSGLKNFVKTEEIKWKCKQCGGQRCVHRSFCLQCKDHSANIPTMNFLKKQNT